MAFQQINPSPSLPADLLHLSFVGLKWESGSNCVKDFKAFIKPALRASQKGHCCYCRRQLSDDIAVDIEHYIEKSVVPQLTFEIQNLALSCKTCNSNKNSTFQRLSSRIKRDKVKKGSSNTTNQSPAIGKYDYSVGVNAQNYRWVHPHFHIYSQHIKIHCGWIYEGKSKLGIKTIKGLELNKIGQIEQRALEERVYSKVSVPAKIIITLISESNYSFPQKMNAILSSLRNQLAT